MGDLADAEVAIAFVFPSAPVGENVAELVFVHGDLEGRIRQEVARLIGPGQTAQKGQQDGEKAKIRDKCIDGSPQCQKMFVPQVFRVCESYGASRGGTGAIVGLVLGCDIPCGVRAPW